MPRQTELIAISALLMSSVALSIDIMLPSLGDIAAAFGLQQDNDRQLTIVMVLAGLTFGQFIFGPCSEATGRKPMIFLGLGIFCAGSVVCATAISYGQKSHNIYYDKFYPTVRYDPNRCRHMLPTG